MFFKLKYCANLVKEHENKEFKLEMEAEDYTEQQLKTSLNLEKDVRKLVVGNVPTAQAQSLYRTLNESYDKTLERLQHARATDWAKFKNQSGEA